MTIEGPGFEQFEVEVGRALEDWLCSGLTGDDREDGHLDAVDQAGGQPS